MLANTIAGRKQEQEELLDALDSNKAEFIVLYGRRRIGKTFLIEELFSKNRCCFFRATGLQNGLIKEQLQEFAQAIGDTFYNGITIAPPASWMNALATLSKAIEVIPKNQQVILFFDEFPWMCTKKSRLIQAIDYYWNRYWKNEPRLKLVICGSSAAWIIRKIIHHKGGLHNRNTRTILLRPFDLSETKHFFKLANNPLTNEQLIQIYMFCDGVVTLDNLIH